MIIPRSFEREWWMIINDKLVKRQCVAAGRRILVQGLKKMENSRKMLSQWSQWSLVP